MAIYKIVIPGNSGYSKQGGTTFRVLGRSFTVELNAIVSANNPDIRAALATVVDERGIGKPRMIEAAVAGIPAIDLDLLPIVGAR